MTAVKNIWFERKDFLEMLLKNANDAIDTIYKAGELNSDSLLGTLCLNEVAHFECLSYLKGIKAPANAKAIADIQTETIVDAAGELKSIRQFIPVDDSDIPTLRNPQNPHDEFPKD